MIDVYCSHFQHAKIEHYQHSDSYLVINLLFEFIRNFNLPFSESMIVSFNGLELNFNDQSEIGDYYNHENILNIHICESAESLQENVENLFDTHISEYLQTVNVQVYFANSQLEHFFNQVLSNSSINLKESVETALVKYFENRKNLQVLQLVNSSNYQVLIPELYYERRFGVMNAENNLELVETIKSTADYFRITCQDSTVDLKKITKVNVNFKTENHDCDSSRSVESKIFMFCNLIRYFNRSKSQPWTSSFLTCDERSIWEHPFTKTFPNWSELFDSKKAIEMAHLVHKSCKGSQLGQVEEVSSFFIKGSSGAGKTYLASQALSGMIGIQRMFKGDSGGLGGDLVGKSHSILDKWFEEARSTPYILRYFILDECHKLFSTQNNSSSESKSDKDIGTYLLDKMSDRRNYSNVIFVLCTNMPYLVPEETIRPGRIDEVVRVLNISQQSLTNILRKFFLISKEDHVQKLIHLLTNASPATIMNMYKKLNEKNDRYENLLEIIRKWAENEGNHFVSEMTFVDESQIGMFKHMPRYFDILVNDNSGATQLKTFLSLFQIKCGLGPCRLMKWINRSFIKERTFQNKYEKFFNDLLQEIQETSQDSPNEFILLIIEPQDIAGEIVNSISHGITGSSSQTKTVGSNRSQQHGTSTSKQKGINLSTTFSNTIGYSHQNGFTDTVGSSQTSTTGTSHQSGTSGGISIGLSPSISFGSNSSTTNSHSNSNSTSHSVSGSTSVGRNYSNSIADAVGRSTGTTTGTQDSVTVSSSDSFAQQIGQSLNRNEVLTITEPEIKMEFEKFLRNLQTRIENRNRNINNIAIISLRKSSQF